MPNAAPFPRPLGTTSSPNGAARLPAGRSALSLDVKGALKVLDVSFRYGAADQFVLRDISLDVAPGEFVAITGPSGGGKTTLMKLLLGLHRPTSGVIELDGNRADPQMWRAWRACVGVVAQDANSSAAIASRFIFVPSRDLRAFGARE